jgi:hypothetical protein
MISKKHWTAISRTVLTCLWVQQPLAVLSDEGQIAELFLVVAVDPSRKRRHMSVLPSKNGLAPSDGSHDTGGYQNRTSAEREGYDR